MAFGESPGQLVVPPYTHAVVKQVVAERTARDLLVNRMDVTQQITEELRTKLAASYILLDDVAIVSLDYNEAFVARMEKLHAQQHQ